MDFKKRLQQVSLLSSFMHDEGKTDISILKLVNYNLLFFVPILLALLLALWIGKTYHTYFEASAAVTARILMIYFTIIIFFFIVPFIRRREKLAGVRYSIVAFFLVGIGITLPSMIKGDLSLFSNLLIYFGSYTLITFFISPDVLGIEKNIKQWFKHHKQLNIIAVFLTITLLYIFGFAATYYAIYQDQTNSNTFNLGFKKEVGFGTFLYYSVVTFATVGYGDITPLSTAARLTAGTHIILSTVVNVLFIAIILVFVSSAQAMTEETTKEAIEKVEEEEKRGLKKEEKEILNVEREVEKVDRNRPPNNGWRPEVVDELRKL
ncbi:two pore domain potassium channel family protein [Candidatus Woesearchaeota archaeon]|nr:two pore domain potassium channel family protein [Candidatus Woesearchaeota archaeon]